MSLIPAFVLACPLVFYDPVGAFSEKLLVIITSGASSLQNVSIKFFSCFPIAKKG